MSTSRSVSVRRRSPCSGGSGHGAHQPADRAHAGERRQQRAEAVGIGDDRLGASALDRVETGRVARAAADGVAVRAQRLREGRGRGSRSPRSGRAPPQSRCRARRRISARQRSSSATCSRMSASVSSRRPLARRLAFCASSI